MANLTRLLNDCPIDSAHSTLEKAGLLRAATVEELRAEGAPVHHYRVYYTGSIDITVSAGDNKQAIALANMALEDVDIGDVDWDVEEVRLLS